MIFFFFLFKTLIETAKIVIRQVSDLRLHCLVGGIANMAVPQSGRYDFVYLFSYTVVFILMIALLCTGD